MVETPDPNDGRKFARSGDGVNRSEEFALMDLFIVIVKHKGLVIGITMGAAVISLVIAMLLPKIYTGTAIVMPPQEDQSSAKALLGQFLASGAPGNGIASTLGLKNPNDLYVGILKSRTIADKIIDRFKLQQHYDKETLVDTRIALFQRSTITAQKDGLIRVEFEDEDPRLAADIANAYIDELENLTGHLAISDASRRRVFYQQRMDQARKELAKADIALKTVQEQTGLIRPDNQASAIFETIATLKGNVAAKQIELTAMRTFATKHHPAYIRAQEELASMARQLAGLERENKLGDGDILLPARKIPEAGLQFLEKWRDVKYQETVYEALSKQLELARIDEGKNATLIQFVDRAIAPDKKSKPKRGLIVAVTTILAAFLAVALAFAREALACASADSSWAGKVSTLKAYLSASWRH